MEEFLTAKATTGEQLLLRRDRIETAMFDDKCCYIFMFSGCNFSIGGDLEVFKKWYEGEI